MANRDFYHSADEWHEAFKTNFSDRNIVLYLSFGEPTISKGFNDIVQMVAKENRWILHITSNLSMPLPWWSEFVSNKLCKEGRFYVNASFHPTQTSISDFLKKLLFLRQHGIECPVIIVMWPPTIRSFERYFEVFNRHNFIVHVRRFQGWYDGKYYPRAYSETERQLVARYADDATIKYTLNEKSHKGKLSWAGCQYILIDEYGNVWESPDSRGCRLGNVFKGDVKLHNEPQPYSGRACASVQGVAALLESGYPELEPNFVVSFAKHGGVYKTKQGVHYKNINVDFKNPRIRKEYAMPNSFGKIKLAFFEVFLDPLYTKLYTCPRFPPLKIIFRLLSGFYAYPPGHLVREHIQLTKKKSFYDKLFDRF